MSLNLTSTVRSSGNMNWISILYGTLIAVICSILLIAIGGLVLYNADYERLVPVVGLAIVFLSVFIGGLVSARQAGKLGWLHGLGVALIFLVLTIFYNMVLPDSIFGFTVFKKILAAAAAGCLGGIWGVGQG